MIWIDLIYNLTLLVALSVVSGFVESRWKRDTRLGTVLQGAVFGGAAVIGMLRPFVFSPGLIFDGRSVMISLGALFFGPWTAAVACLMTIPLRVFQGGPGTIMGVLVILASATIGVSFYLRRSRRSGEMTIATLLVFGLLVHLTMLVMTVALPREMTLPVLKRIALPVILTYPLATVLIGKILLDQAARGSFLQSLRESEERLRLAQAAAGIGTWDVDLIRDYTTWSEQEETLFGFAPGTYDHTSATFWSLVHPDDRERLRQAVERVQTDGGEFQAEYRIHRHGDSALRWIAVCGRAIRDPKGRTIRMLGVNQDITERKRVEEALSESQSRLSLFFSQSLDGFYFSELDEPVAWHAQTNKDEVLAYLCEHQRITDANSAFLAQYGASRENLVGRPISAFFRHDNAKGLALQRRLFDEGRLRVETCERKDDGTMVWIEGDYVCIYDEQHRIVGTFGVQRDISERHRAELLQQAVFRIAEAALAAENLDALYDSIHATVGELMPAQNFFIALLDPAAGLLHFPYFKDERDAPPGPLKPVGTLAGYVVRTGKPLLATGAMGRRLIELGEADLVGSPSVDWLGVPLKTPRGETIGVMAVQTYSEAARLRKADEEVLVFVSTQVAQAIERKRAEAELALNHERYQRAIAAANAIPYQKEYGTDTYVFMGEGIKDLTGYSPSELRSAVWREMILETVFLGEAAGLERAEAARRAVAGELKHWRADHRIRARTGEIRWISDSSIPLFSDAGQYAGSMGIIQDITERKLAEEAIRKSESSLAMAQRVAHLGSWEIDLRQDTLQWSEETYRIFGLLPGAIVPTRVDFQARVHPDDRDRVRAAVQRAIETRQTYAVDHRILRPNGTERIVSERADILTDPNGVPVQMVGTVQDVTELKRAEQALQRSEKHFRSIIDTVQDLISLVDIGGVIRFASPSAGRTLGYTPEQLLDREVFDFIPPEEHAAVRTVLAQSLGEPHQPIVLQHHFRHADGSWRMLESVGNLLASELTQAVVVNSRDITDRRRLEEQLRQSQKMEAIGQLAAGVAHDFNNLLTIIQGNASLMLGAPGLSGEDASAIRQVIEAAERAAGLTRQLLMFSRKQIMRLASLDLNEVVGNMTKMLQRILGEDISLRSEYSPNLPLIQADAGMLEQVLLNLAVNARDAMPAGGQLVVKTSVVTWGVQDLEQHPGASAGPHICLSVADTGCGITPENLPRIFDPFFTTKEVGKGTGLGLATVYGIVKQHHGWIEVTSEVAKGTAFQIYLPAVEGTSASRRVEGELRDLPRGTEVILVVEDESAVRQLVNNLLQRCGYAVLLAPSGVVALEVWKEHKNRIALLLTDMVMPDGISGLELASRLQADQPSLKTIYSSGYSATVGSKGPKLVEGVNFLQKPYSAHQLAKTVRACLDRD